MEQAITIQNLVKTYGTSDARLGGVGQKLALNNLNLSVPQGSMFALLGPNGAGKSSLINILAGTVIKTSGLVNIMGHDIDFQPKLASQQIGIVPQEIVIDNFFPITKNLEFTAGYYGIRPQFRRTEEILKALGLWGKKDALPRQLSGGMKRRFLIARAMVHSPKILILDEPTAGVDIELREQLWSYVRKLNSQGTTVIITTHYLQEAQELCEEIAFINQGEIIKQDSKNNLLSMLGTRHIDVEFTQLLYADMVEGKFPSDNYEILAANKLRIHFNEEECSFNQLIAKLSDLKLDIKNIEVNQPDLETVYKRYFKGSANQ